MPRSLPRAERRPTVVDLFAGAGGLSLGFESAGWDVVAAIEYDGVHAATHRYNFPNTEVLCRDVTSLSAEDVRSAAARGFAAHRPERAWDGDLDAVVGGPPCQGFSLIGRRLVDDHRNRLVYDFIRLATDLNPKYIVMENVPGMLAGGHSGILTQVVAELNERGYRVRAPIAILNAADHGVPQRRRRLFLMAAREGNPLPEYPAPTSIAPATSGHAQLHAAGLPLGPTVRDAIGDLPNADSFAELLTSDQVWLTDTEVTRCISRASEYALRLRGRAPDPRDFSYIRESTDSLLTSSMRTTHRASTITRFENTEQGRFEPVSRFYRLSPDGLANTIRAGTGSDHGAFSSPRPIHPSFNRVITVREAARLHGFPDWFRFNRTKWHGFRQVGNSVPPLLGRAVAREVSKSLGLGASKPHLAIKLNREWLLSLDMTEAAATFGADRGAMPSPRRPAARTPDVEPVSNLPSQGDDLLSRAG